MRHHPKLPQIILQLLSQTRPDQDHEHHHHKHHNHDMLPPADVDHSSPQLYRNIDENSDDKYRESDHVHHDFLVLHSTQRRHGVCNRHADQHPAAELGELVDSAGHGGVEIDRELDCYRHDG